MPNYAPNPYHTQTPIGQSLQNLVGAYFQSKLMEGQRADQQAQLALKQREYDEVTLPMKQAQMEQYAAQSRQQDALAGKAQEETARMQSMPGVIAQAMTQLTAPQLGKVREYQQTGSYGEAPTIPGLDQLGQGGDWMPTYAKPETMNQLSIADTVSAMPGNADQLAKAMQGMSNMQFIQSNPSAADAGVRGRATAATQGDALYSNPNSQGLLADIFTGMVMNQDNPLANAQVSADRALAGERNATAGLRREQVNTEKAQQRNYDEPNGGVGGRSGGGLKGGLTEKQRFDIRKKDDEILTARKKIKAFKDSGKKIGDMGSNKEFQKTKAMAMQRMQEGEDTGHQTWVDYLSGGYEDKDAWAAHSQQPAQGAQPAQQSAVPPPAQRVRGQVYQTPKGPMTWTGTGWVPGA